MNRLAASLVVPSLLLAGCSMSAGVRTPFGPARVAPAPAAPPPAYASPGAPADPGAPPPPAGAPVACVEELGGDASHKLPEAVAIAPGRIDGCMAPYDEGDAFALTAPPGPNLLVQLELDPIEDWQACIELFDQDRAKVGNIHCDRGVKRPWVVIAGGTTVHVLVHAFQKDYADGKTLRPWALTVTTHAYDDATAAATSIPRAARLAPGTAAYGYLIDPINGGDDADVFEIPVARAGSLEIVVDEVPDTAKLRLELLDRDGKRIVQEYSNTDGAVGRLTRDVKPGTYYLRMTSPQYDRPSRGVKELPEHVTKPYRVTAALK